MSFDSIDLARFGWNSLFQNQFQPFDEKGYWAGRVIIEHKAMYKLYTGKYTPETEVLAELAGRLRYEATARDNLPAVGDWVVIEPYPRGSRAKIVEVLPRASKFVRKQPGRVAEEQIVGTNIDTIFLVNSLNHDLNPRRIERYLVLAWESGARPVILLNKADLCDDIESHVLSIQAIAGGVPIVVVSAIDDQGLDALRPYLTQGQTVALLGSSGVGKSTLINCLLGQEVQKVQAVRAGDDRGRHTTTSRELIMLPDGALVLDTPGMRELQLWEGEAGIGTVFDEIEGLSNQCRFRDCQHVAEPGCAVRQALDDGEIDEGRYQSYEKLRKEIKHAALKLDKLGQIEEKKRWKKLTKLGKERSIEKRR